MAATSRQSAQPVTPDPMIQQREGIEAVRRAVHIFNAAERRNRRKYGRVDGLLPLGHLRALYVLLMNDREATAGELAREAELKPGSTTAMLDNLEAKGLVRRRRDPIDRRVCWVSLTERGRLEVAEKEAIWSRILSRAFADTPESDLLAASRVLGRLADLFDGFADAVDDDE